MLAFVAVEAKVVMALRIQDWDDVAIASLVARKRCLGCGAPLPAQIKFGSCLICSASGFLVRGACRGMTNGAPAGLAIRALKLR